MDLHTNGYKSIHIHPNPTNAVENPFRSTYLFDGQNLGNVLFPDGPAAPAVRIKVVWCTVEPKFLFSILFLDDF